jgi:hypothetical protein
MFIASFTCLALIVAEGVGVHAHPLIVNGTLPEFMSSYGFD